LSVGGGILKRGGGFAKRGTKRRYLRHPLSLWGEDGGEEKGKVKRLKRGQNEQCISGKRSNEKGRKRKSKGIMVLGALSSQE